MIQLPSAFQGHVLVSSRATMVRVQSRDAIVGVS